MKIALAQINPTIGDFDQNRSIIRDSCIRARSLGAELIVFPELSLCGYPPMDLLDHETFVEESIRSLRHLQSEIPEEPAAVVGYVDVNQSGDGKGLQNAAAVIYDGRIIHRQAKRLLPTYDVFDEARYFEPADSSEVFAFGGTIFGIAICEDIWWETERETGMKYPDDPVRDLVDRGAQIILAPSASPFHRSKLSIRHSLVQSIGRNNAVPAIYVNMTGANDSLIFDGFSFVCDAGGEIIHQSPGFQEDLAIVELQTGTTAGKRSISTEPANDVRRQGYDEPAMIESALILGIRDYLKKTGFSRVHLGLSGGIDSALVTALATRAVGAENVHAFLMPSRYSSKGSLSDSELLCRNLGIGSTRIPIEQVFTAFTDSLAETFAGLPENVAEENIQARIRGTFLMAYSNKTGSLPLTTGNKSELAVGYSTLYGDMAGSLAVIGDLFKTEVYELARYLNQNREIIPEAILSKAPSAELRPDQKDEDSLPPYDLLDRILHAYLVESRTYQEIVGRGIDSEVVSQVLRLVGRAEYKRRQAPPVLKVSPRAFGTGRRMPIARHIYEERR